MPDDIELTRRRVLGGLAAVGLGSATAGAGTMAAFSDSESSTGNSVEAGTLDLTLNGSNSTVTFLDANGATPGDSGQGSVTLANAGTVAATPTVTIADIRPTDRNGNSGGQLDDHLDVRATLGKGTANETTIWSRQTVASLSAGTTYNGGSAFGGGDSRSFTLEWWLPQNTPNSAQGDSVEIDLTFRLEQSGP